jgi:hypothetical protein
MHMRLDDAARAERMAVCDAACESAIGILHG